MKYHLITYGCQMNTADSEEMAQPLESRGFRQTAQLQEADVVLMNTCTVREQAEHRAKSNLGRLKDWKAANPNRILIVAGCAASRWGDSIKKRYPYIDLVSPATQIEKFPEVVAEVLKERWNFQNETGKYFGGKSGNGDKGNTRTTLTTPTTLTTAVAPPSTDLFGDANTSYVTIMRGCNYSCSYCIVPQVRGREVYRPMPEILREVEEKTSRGLRDVMLLGQTVNSYFFKTETGSVDFADLLRAVDAVPSVERIRFMSPHPRHMRDRVIAAMRDCGKVCRHIHLPVQSGSSRLLEAMNRLYNRDHYISIVQKLREAMPDIMITTDLIVGFPGEAEADFEESLALMRDVHFDGLFAFKFSPRPGTPAALQKDDVLAEVKEERLQRVLALNKELQAAKAKGGACLA
jgi:tRNA-2-methylthio-N6-dimethylallyladenosine synthase